MSGFQLPFLVFEIDSSEGAAAFGLDAAGVMQVIDVADSGVLTPVPLAPVAVRGIMNHNGRIVTVIDPAPLLGVSSMPREPGQIIVLRRDGRSKGYVGLLTRKISEILAKSSLERVEVETGPCVAWVARAKRRLIPIVEPEALIDKLGLQFRPPERGESLGVDL